MGSGFAHELVNDTSASSRESLSDSLLIQRFMCYLIFCIIIKGDGNPDGYYGLYKRS